MKINTEKKNFCSYRAVLIAKTVFLLPSSTNECLLVGVVCGSVVDKTLFFSYYGEYFLAFTFLIAIVKIHIFEGGQANCDDIGQHKIDLDTEKTKRIRQDRDKSSQSRFTKKKRKCFEKGRSVDVIRSQTDDKKFVKNAFQT
jgi:hypothetical protein